MGVMNYAEEFKSQAVDFSEFDVTIPHDTH